jgi:predicted PurR-regulated permease PerM
MNDRSPSPEKPKEREQPIVVRSPIGIRSAALSALALVAVVFALREAYSVFIPVVLGVLAAYALSPIVSRLEAVGVSRWISSAMLLVVLVGGIGWVAYTLREDAAAIVEQLPEAARRLQQSFSPGAGEKTATVDTIREAADELEKAATEVAPKPAPPEGVTPVQVVEPAVDVRGYLLSGTLGVATVIGQAGVVLFLMFFLLGSGDLFKRKLVRIAGPSIGSRRITVEILDEINRQIERFLVVRLAASIIVALVSWPAFRLMGLEYAGVWAIAAGILNIIPYFGPIIIAVGVAVAAFLQFGSVVQAAAVSAVSLVITGLEGWLLTPWLSSRATHMNAVAIFVGLVFWTWIWGIWGTVLAVPIMTVIKAVCDKVEDLKPVGELLGD